MFLSGELWIYLANLNQQAQNRLERTIGQMKMTEGVTEELKAIDPTVWVQRMNNIRARAEEIIRSEPLFSEIGVDTWVICATGFVAMVTFGVLTEKEASINWPMAILA